MSDVTALAPLMSLTDSSMSRRANASYVMLPHGVLRQACTLQMNLRFLEQATAPSRSASIREDFLLQDFVPIAE